MRQTLGMTSTTVVGASVAGLLAARVLSDLVDEVVVIERERLTDAPSPRGHVPQGKHLHLLLTAGLDLLVDWFPGSTTSSQGWVPPGSTAAARGSTRPGATARKATGADPPSA